MAGDSGGGEKSFPASQRKLQKARQKGQVASSSDFITAMVVAAVLISVSIIWQDLALLFTGLFNQAVDPNFTGNENMKLLLQTMATGLFSKLGLMFAITAGTIIVAHLAHKGGPVISIDPIIPKFERISPADGFKRIFGNRAWVDLGTTFLRLLLWFSAAALIIYTFIPPLIKAPTCGLDCSLNISISAFKRLVTVALLFLIVWGLLDLPLQVFMFRKQQRMTMKEVKDEARESQGSPEMLQHRKQLQRSAAQQQGFRDASFLIISTDYVVAVQYIHGTMPAPVVVAKARGDHATKLLELAQKFNIPIEVSPDVAIRLYNGKIGAYVPESEYDALVPMIMRHVKLD